MEEGHIRAHTQEPGRGGGGRHRGRLRPGQPVGPLGEVPPPSALMTWLPLSTATQHQRGDPRAQEDEVPPLSPPAAGSLLLLRARLACAPGTACGRDFLRAAASCMTSFHAGRGEPWTGPLQPNARSQSLGAPVSLPHGPSHLCGPVSLLRTSAGWLVSSREPQVLAGTVWEQTHNLVTT